MLKYISQSTISEAVQNFRGQSSFKKQEQIGLFLYFKAFNTNPYSLVSYPKWGDRDNESKERCLRVLYDLSGTFNATNEIGKKRSCLFPTAIRAAKFFNEGTHFNGLGSRITDTLNNALVSSFMKHGQNDENTIAFQENYIETLQDRFFCGGRISLEYLAYWYFKFWSFDITTDYSDRDISDACILSFISSFHLLPDEYKNLFSYGDRTLSLDKQMISGESFRRLLNLSPDKRPETETVANLRMNGNSFQPYMTMTTETIGHILEMRHGDHLTEERIIEILSEHEEELRKMAKDESEEQENPRHVFEFAARSPRQNNTFPLNAIMYGAPGTGKTYSTATYAVAVIEKMPLENASSISRNEIMKRYAHYIESGRIVFTTFHQNYSYEDFIQGIKPKVNNRNAGSLSFCLEDGIFKKIAQAAMLSGDSNFILIIDEINRANISKVFGELITLIEDDKRWGELNALSVMLPSGERFAVPNNLYILGTMNSADKSISLIDTALRRRFEFIEVSPDSRRITDTQLRTVFEQLNTELYKELDSTDLLIGHAYFIGRSLSDLCTIFNRSIIPLLYEYFYDNSKKVENVIKCAISGFTNFEVQKTAMGRLRLVKKD